MESLIESPRAGFISGSNLPASAQFPLHRLVLPVLCVAIGVSVGSATGLTLALVNASENPVAASSRSFEAIAAPATKLTSNPDPVPTAEPAVTMSASTAATSSTASMEKAASSPVELPSAGLNSLIKYPAPASSKIEGALNKTPDALRPATFKLGGKVYQAARMTFVSVPKAQEQADTSAEGPIPAPLNAAQLGLNAPPGSSSLYTEGMLTVSDYSASTRTIQTSDGKTFVLGTTVAVGDATSWETYRSKLRYRCDENGSCVLMRAGVVAPDAKLI